MQTLRTLTVRFTFLKKFSIYHRHELYHLISDYKELVAAILLKKHWKKKHLHCTTMIIENDCLVNFSPIDA